MKTRDTDLCQALSEPLRKRDAALVVGGAALLRITMLTEGEIIFNKEEEEEESLNSLSSSVAVEITVFFTG